MRTILLRAYVFNPVSEMFYNFLLKLNMAYRKHVILVLLVHKQNSLWPVAERWSHLDVEKPRHNIFFQTS